MTHKRTATLANTPRANRLPALVMALALMAGSALTARAADRKVKVTKRYLNYPITYTGDRHDITFSIGHEVLCRTSARLAAGKPDYWTFQDVSRWHGKTINIHYDGPQEALDRILLADTLCEGSTMGHEAERPLYHFSSRRGWLNDPNGLIFAQGQYHMFYQHDPFDRDGGQKHWGHAVSTDLMHWDELPDALHPDEHGAIWSGSAVMDYNNTAGFNAKDGTPAMVVTYTVECPEKQTQYVAYSTDGGKTFTEYEGNPVIDSHMKWQTRDTRDPRVFWYAPGEHWVLVLNEREGHSIYNSTDLKHWTYESHVTGFWECPDLFELPVDGNSDDKKWVLWGASGTYMVGTFDGKQFTPLTPKQKNMGGSGYAAQVFNGTQEHDGRVIKMTWGRIYYDRTPFNCVMLLPQEQLLKSRKGGGWELVSRPVREVYDQFDLDASGEDLTQEEANKMLAPYASNDLLRVRLTLELTYATDAGLSLGKQRLIDYDLNGNRLNGDFYATEQPGSLTLDADVYVDRSVVEVFIDGGRYSYSFGRDVKRNQGSSYSIYGNQVKVKRLEVYRLRQS